MDQRNHYALELVAESRYQFELVKRAVYTHYAPCNIGGLPQNYRDTECDYLLSVESVSKWTKPQLAELRLFIRGVIAASKCI